MTSSSIVPWAFEPTGLRAQAAAGVRLADLMATLCTDAFVFAPGDSHAPGAEPVAEGLADVVDPVRALQGFDEDRKRALWGKLKLLDGVMRRHFNSPDDTVLSSSVTCLQTPGGPAPVCWVRKSAKGVVQLQLGRVTVDLVAGTVSMDKPPEPALPGVRFAIRAAGVGAVVGAASDLISVVNSGAWALPPPWGAGVTVGLTLLQMLLGKVGAEGQVSPFKTLQDDLQDYMQRAKLGDYASDFHAFSHELDAKLSGLEMSADKIGDQGEDYFAETESWLTGAFGYEMVLNRVERLHDLLAERDLDNCQAELDLFLTGLMLWTFGRKTHLTMVAIEATRARKLGDEEAFFNKTHSWLSEYREIRNVLCGTTTEPFSGYFPMLNAQLSRLRSQRIAKIGDVRDWSFSEAVGDNVSKKHYGFTFGDDLEDDSFNKHYVENGTESKGCFDLEEVPSRPTVEARRPEYIAKINAHADAVFEGAVRMSASLNQALNEFAGMLPPDKTDDAPKATPVTGGPPTPAAGSWSKGERVQYAMSYQNEKGPSELGPWSDALIVGDTAFARVELPQVPQAVRTGTQLLHRRMYADGEGGVARARTIAILELTETLHDDREP